MEILKEFKEPLKGENFCLALIPIEKLRIVSEQRKPSKLHIERLKKSMALLGFTTPVIAVKKRSNFVIVDGQHRFLAAKEMNAKFLPCIVIPEKFSLYLIELNAEKSLTIREKAHVALQIYKKLIEEAPALLETAPKVHDLVESVHLVTFGLAYEVNEKFIGSAFQSLAMKIDNALDKALVETIKVREKRAKKWLEANKLVKEIAEKLKELLGKFPPFLYQTIVATANPIKRKKIIKESFEEVLNRFILKLAEIKEEPRVLLK